MYCTCLHVPLRMRIEIRCGFKSSTPSLTKASEAWAVKNEASFFCGPEGIQGTYPPNKEKDKAPLCSPNCHPCPIPRHTRIPFNTRTRVWEPLLSSETFLEVPQFPQLRRLVLINHAEGEVQPCLSKPARETEAGKRPCRGEGEGARGLPIKEAGHQRAGLELILSRTFGGQKAPVIPAKCIQTHLVPVSRSVNGELTYRASKRPLGGVPGWLGRSGSGSGFGSGHDLTVCGFEPRVGPSAVSTEPASDPLSSSLCPSPTHSLLLSLSK